MSADTKDLEREIARVEARTSFLRIASIALLTITLHRIVLAILFGDAS